MIYNESLTNKLIRLFGEGVISWTKAKIRNELEGYLSLVNGRILKLENSNLINDAIVLYQEVKDIDDQFMEYYTIELDKIDINK